MNCWMSEKFSSRKYYGKKRWKSSRLSQQQEGPRTTRQICWKRFCSSNCLLSMVFEKRRKKRILG